MGKVSLGGMGGNKLVTGPLGWKPGSIVLPTIDGAADLGTSAVSITEIP